MYVLNYVCPRCNMLAKGCALEGYRSTQRNAARDTHFITNMY